MKGSQDDPYRCPICWKWFVVPSLTAEHMRREHTQEVAA